MVRPKKLFISQENDWHEPALSIYDVYTVFLHNEKNNKAVVDIKLRFFGNIIVMIIVRMSYIHCA